MQSTHLELSQEYAIMIASVLAEIVEQTDKLLQQPGISNLDKAITKFHATRPPAIAVKEYLLRVVKYANCSESCYILALIYIDRLTEKRPGFVINSLNIHRLLITSIMVAAKFFDDFYFYNNDYAKIGGISTKEINSLEAELLVLLNFELFVSEDTFSHYKAQLSYHVAEKIQNSNSQALSHVDSELQQTHFNNSPSQDESTDNSNASNTEEEKKYNIEGNGSNKFSKMSQVLKHLSTSTIAFHKERKNSNPTKALRPDVHSDASTSQSEAIPNKDSPYIKGSGISSPKQLAEPKKRTYIDVGSSYGMKLVETNPNAPYSFLVF